MADLTPEEAALFTSRLAAEHRLSLAQISALTIADLNNLFQLLMDEPDDVFARGIRETMPQIIQAYAPAAVALSAGLYTNCRELYILSGQAPRSVAAFVPDTTKFLTSEIPKKIIDEAVGESFYWAGNAINGKFERSQVVTPVQQIASKAIFNYSREITEEAMKEDDAATESARREVSSNGCRFCKSMAFDVGISDKNFHHKDKETKEIVPTFHKGCGCVKVAAFKNQLENRPPWADQFEADRDKAYREIMDYNEGLRHERIAYMTDRVNSKGKLVTERKFRDEYTDKDGNPAKPIPLTTKNILSAMGKNDRNHSH